MIDDSLSIDNTLNTERNSGKTVFCFQSVVFLFTLGVVFSFSENTTLGLMYDVVLLFELLFFLFYALTVEKIDKTEIVLLLLVAAMTVFRVVFIFIDSPQYNIRCIIQIGMIIALLLFASKIKLRKEDVSFYNVLLFAVNILGLIDYFMSKDKIVFAVFGSMNTLAGTFLFLLCLDIILMQWQMKRRYIANIILCLVIIFLSSSRTPLLMLGAFLVCLVLLKTVFKSVKGRKFLFILFVVVGTLLIYAYINIDKWPIYSVINEWSLKLFGKNINSGRPLIWAETLELIKNDWLFGVGFVEHAHGNSGHNQFIQLLGDNGVVGLLLFIVFLQVIWNKLSKYGSDKTVRVCMALMLSFLVYNCFEVTLLQNKFALGCLQWLVIGIGLGRCRYLQRKIVENKTNQNDKEIGYEVL